MTLKEQANRKKSPRNKNENFRDGKPLEKAILKEEKRSIDNEELR